MAAGTGIALSNSSDGKYTTITANPDLSSYATSTALASVTANPVLRTGINSMSIQNVAGVILGAFQTNASPCFVNNSIQTGSLTATSFSVLQVPNSYPVFTLTPTTTTVRNNFAVATGSTASL